MTALLAPGRILDADHNQPSAERTDMHYPLDAQYAHAVAWQKTQRTRAATRQQLPPRRGLVRLRAIKPVDPTSTRRDW